MSNGIKTGVWSLTLDDLLMDQKSFNQPNSDLLMDKKSFNQPDSTLPSSPPLPQTVPPARPTRTLAQPRPIVIGIEEN